MRKIYFFCLVVLNLSIAKAQHGATNLQPITKGQAFNISSNLPTKKYGNILRGIGKTLGIAALSYQTTKQVTNGKDNSTTISNNLLPAIGLGAVVSYKDFLPKKHKPLSIAYKLYDENMQLVQVEEVPIKKQVPAIKGTAPKNGYIEAFVIDKSQVMPQLSFERADIDIMPLPKPSLGGSIANDLQLMTYGECLGSGEGGDDTDDGEPDFSMSFDGIEYDFWDLDGDGYMDKMGYGLPNGEVVVVDLNNHPEIDPEEFPSIMEGYDPEIWPSVDDYLDWYEENVINDDGQNGAHKPIEESSNKCAGMSSMWNKAVAANKEGFGLITKDGGFIFTQYTDILGGEPIFGIKNIDGHYYYRYPVSEGAPSSAHTSDGTYYYIEIVGTVHTHNNCLNDGSSGLSYSDPSDEDVALGTVHSSLTHYILGCNTLGKIAAYGNGYYDIQSGTPSSKCNYFN